MAMNSPLDERPTTDPENKGRHDNALSPKQKPPEPPKVDTPKAEPKVDHLAEIEHLARSTRTTSPSGSETLCQKILEHVQALRDPAAYDKREAEKRAEAEKHDAKQAEQIAERKGNLPHQAPQTAQRLP